MKEFEIAFPINRDFDMGQARAEAAYASASAEACASRSEACPRSSRSAAS